MAVPDNPRGRITSVYAELLNPENPDEDATVRVCVWTPHKIFDAEGERVVLELSDLHAPIRKLIDTKEWCLSGLIEPEKSFDNIRRDSPGINLAYIDPLNETPIDRWEIREKPEICT
jgi:hypothetical protein